MLALICQWCAVMTVPVENKIDSIFLAVLRESPAHTDQVNCRHSQAVMAAIVLGFQ